MVLDEVKALTFDVFGTVVDWRGSLIRELESLAGEKGLEIDAGAFADGWRGAYAPSMQRVRSGELPWTKLDVLHRTAMEELLKRFGIPGLSEAEKDALNRAWHRLQPWPDSIPGLTRLRRRFTLATLSNGNVALLVNMARHVGLPWDCILSAEIARHYKPDREVYQMACELLDLPPAQVMMVAAHNHDLLAARALGMATAWVARPREHGPVEPPPPGPAADYDVIASDIGELADGLGV